jgi:hypothetical protein
MMMIDNFIIRKDDSDSKYNGKFFIVSSEGPYYGLTTDGQVINSTFNIPTVNLYWETREAAESALRNYLNPAPKSKIVYVIVQNGQPLFVSKDPVDVYEVDSDFAPEINHV